MRQVAHTLSHVGHHGEPGEQRGGNGQVGCLDIVTASCHGAWLFGSVCHLGSTGRVWPSL